MPGRRLRRALLAAGALVALLSPVAGAEPALVQVGSLVVKADGRFEPNILPKRRYVPIAFHGRVDISDVRGERPTPLQRVIIDFDRDGRLTPGGLPECPAERLLAASVEQARRLCGAALVGTGRLKALVQVGPVAVPTGSALSLFNGPRLGGEPTVTVHAQTAVPTPETYAFAVPIKRRGGAYRYRAVVDLPPLAGGLGSVAHIDLRVERRFYADGLRRSYTAARCGDGVVGTRGQFKFSDGTIVEGTIERPCRVPGGSRRRARS